MMYGKLEGLNKIHKSFIHDITPGIHIQLENIDKSFMGAINDHPLHHYETTRCKTF